MPRCLCVWVPGSVTLQRERFFYLVMPPTIKYRIKRKAAEVPATPPTPQAPALDPGPTVQKERAISNSCDLDAIAAMLRDDTLTGSCVGEPQRMTGVEPQPSPFFGVVLEAAAGGVADGAEFEFEADSEVELSGEESLEEDALVTKEKMRQGREHALKRESFVSSVRKPAVSRVDGTGRRFVSHGPGCVLPP